MYHVLCFELRELVSIAVQLWKLLQTNVSLVLAVCSTSRCLGPLRLGCLILSSMWAWAAVAWQVEALSFLTRIIIWMYFILWCWHSREDIFTTAVRRWLLEPLWIYFKSRLISCTDARTIRHFLFLPNAVKQAGELGLQIFSGIVRGEGRSWIPESVTS